MTGKLMTDAELARHKEFCKRYPPDDALNALLDHIDALRSDIDDRQRSFDLRWKADMRAIKAWQVETGEGLTWPDHADLCVWLMEKLDDPLRNAAPDLLAALIEFAFLGHGKCTIGKPAADIARAAIAKAKGEVTMGHHIDAQGRFQSDRHPDLPPDKIIVSLEHPEAWAALEVLADGYRHIDPELADDIMYRLRLIQAKAKGE